MAQTKTTAKKKSSGSGSKSSGSSKSTKSSARGSQSKSSGRPGASRGSSTAKRSSSSTRSRGSTKAKSRSTGSGSSSRSRTASKTKSGGTRRKSGASAKSRQATQSASNGGGVLDKVKGPATAVGAALIGVAGGVAASRNGKRGSGLLSKGHGSKLSLPKPNSKSGIGKALSAPALKKSLKSINLPKPDASMIDWVEEKAKGVGDAGYRVADMTSDARRVKKAVSGGK